MTVVDVENAYDPLSAGIAEAGAVRELVRRAAASGTLRYVLLLGDDSFDPDDRAGFGGRAFVPSLNGWDGAFGRVASENRYADVNDDGRPDVAIGGSPRARRPRPRPSCRRSSASRLSSPRAGAPRLRGGRPRPRRLRLRRGGASGGGAAAAARAAGWADLAQGVAVARERLFSALAQGAAFTHYFGHGGPETWADEGLVSVEDAASLPSTGTVVLTWACQAQFFQYLFGPSVNESLLLAPRGGAVAAFGPAGITDAPLQAVLYERLYDELRRGRVPLGEAIRRPRVARWTPTRGWGPSSRASTCSATRASPWTCAARSRRSASRRGAAFPERSRLALRARRRAAAAVHLPAAASSAFSRPARCRMRPPRSRPSPPGAPSIRTHRASIVEPVEAPPGLVLLTPKSTTRNSSPPQRRRGRRAHQLTRGPRHGDSRVAEGSLRLSASRSTTATHPEAFPSCAALTIE